MALLSVVIAVWVVIATWDRHVLVVAGAVLPGWLLTAALTISALVIRQRDRRRTATQQHGGVALEPTSRVTPWVLTWPFTAVVTLVLVAATLGALKTSLVSQYVTLTPASPKGCRVIVDETSFLFAGSGEVYLVRGATGVGSKVGTYVTDDGGRPASTGRYELHWSADDGALVLGGPPGAEVIDQDVDSLAC